MVATMRGVWEPGNGFSFILPVQKHNPCYKSDDFPFILDWQNEQCLFYKKSQITISAELAPMQKSLVMCLQ